MCKLFGDSLECVFLAQLRLRFFIDFKMKQCYTEYANNLQLDIYIKTHAFIFVKNADSL